MASSGLQRFGVASDATVTVLSLCIRNALCVSCGVVTMAPSGLERFEVASDATVTAATMHWRCA